MNSNNPDYAFSLATRKDDADIRKLLSSNPMPGSIKLSFETEPSFFNSLQIHGKKNQVIITRDKKKVVGMGMISSQKLYIGGKSAHIGYLSNLRVDRSYRGKGILKNGMKYLKKIDRKDKIGVYYTFIVKKNSIAKKIFLKHKEGFPNFHDMGGVTTYILPIHRENKKNSKNNILKKSYEIRRASKKDSSAIVNFVSQIGRKKNFYPCIDIADFNSDGNAFPQIFYLAYFKNKLAGIISVWDQSKYRQTVVKGYSIPMKIFRAGYNMYSLYTNRKPLPEKNQQFHILYIDHILINNNESSIFEMLLDKVMNNYSENKYQYIVLSLHEKDMLKSTLDSYNYISYESNMYAVTWNAYNKIFNRLKNLPIHIDIGRA
jgi:hypothetical protein